MKGSAEKSVDVAMFDRVASVFLVENYCASSASDVLACENCLDGIKGEANSRADKPSISISVSPPSSRLQYGVESGTCVLGCLVSARPCSPEFAGLHAGDPLLTDWIS